MSLADAADAAEEAGLRYVNDAMPGISRRRQGKGFSYRHPDGSLVSERERERIEAVVVPPAWTDVWICPDPDGHIQATGRDDRGRKQYRYHPRWREARDATKYDSLATFGRTLPDVRARVEADLTRRGLPEEKVLAAVVRLLDETLIRIGNDEYAEANESYGLTTLQDDHAEITGAALTLEFGGKSGTEFDVVVRDRRLAHIVKQCQDLPGEDLFQYVDGDRVIDVTSSHVNAYLREVAGPDRSAKDFRTWGARWWPPRPSSASAPRRPRGSRQQPPGGHRRRRRAPGQHQGGVSQLLCPPPHPRGLRHRLARRRLAPSSSGPPPQPGREDRARGAGGRRGTGLTAVILVGMAPACEQARRWLRWPCGVGGTLPRCPTRRWRRRGKALVTILLKLGCPGSAPHR